MISNKNIGKNGMRASFFGILLAFLPILGGLVNISTSDHRKGAIFATSCAYIGFLFCICLWFFGVPYSTEEPIAGFALTPLSWLMISLVLYISSIIHHYSIRYMEGQNVYSIYMCKLSLITASVMFLIMADHLALLALFWTLSNFLLVSLMAHNRRRPECRQTGVLAAKSFIIGTASLALSFVILYTASGLYSLSDINNNQHTLSGATRNIAGALLILAAAAQSGIFPFHKWLISSLNSPTTVSAFMHAGLINGGGLLIVRFAPLFRESELLMTTIFSFGIASLFLGSIWKPIQHSVKRMLACSTMGQMGFMLVQCGLGLFSAAIAHLIWHGLFKAFLFLRSGSALEENHFVLDKGVKPMLLAGACLCGIPGAWIFAKIAHYPILMIDGSFILVFFAFLATTQVALTILKIIRFRLTYILALLCSVASGAVYGASVRVIENILPNIAANPIEPLSPLHVMTIVLVALYWTALNLEFKRYFLQTDFWKSMYVKLLNASQPSHLTIAS